jgi:hypothetical protein
LTRRYAMAIAGTRVVMKAERFMVASVTWLVEGGQRRVIRDRCGTRREERICRRGTEGEENGENRVNKDPRERSARERHPTEKAKAKEPT